MTIKADIGCVIEQLKKFQEQGYKTVEVIDKARKQSWKKMEPEIEFVFSSNEPDVVGIGVSSETYDS